jgi:ribosomal protein S18 acetylase RimI-like enzyme
MDFQEKAMIEEGKVIFEGKTAKGLDILLRYPKSGDALVLLDFINALSREQTYILFQGEQQTLEEEERYLEGRLTAVANSAGVQLVAYSNGLLAGNTGIDLGWGTNRHRAELGIAVAQRFRGQGVGELLLNAIINEAITHLPELKIVTLEVFGNNASAINLYTKVGFVEFGRLPGGRLHRGEYVDNVYMYKRVREN